MLTSTARSLDRESSTPLSLDHLSKTIYQTSLNQLKKLRIIYPDVLSYEDVLICTGLETLATRTHYSCTKFISRLRSEKEDYNPLACIIRREPPHIYSNYNLRTQTINKSITNTEHFRNFNS